MAAGAAVGEPAGSRPDRALGLVWAQHAARASVGRCARARRDRQPAAGSFLDQHQTSLRARRQPQRRAAVHFLHEHELHVLPALELGVPVPGSGAAFLGAGERLARRGPAAGCRCRRGSRRADYRRAGAALRQSLGLPNAAAGGHAIGSGAADARRQRRQSVPCSGRARLLLRRRGADRRGVLGGGHDGRSRGHHGGVRFHEYRRQPGRHHRAAHRRIFCRPAFMAYRLRHRRRIRRRERARLARHPDRIDGSKRSRRPWSRARQARIRSRH